MTTVIGIYTSNGIVLAADTLNMYVYSGVLNKKTTQNLHGSKIYKFPQGPYLIGISGVDNFPTGYLLAGLREECRKNRHFLIDRLEGKDFPELKRHFGNSDDRQTLVIATPLRDFPGSLFCVSKYAKGEYTVWKAQEDDGCVAAGSGSEHVEELLRKMYSFNLTMPEAEKLAFDALSVANDKDSHSEGYEIWQILENEIISNPVDDDQSKSPRKIAF